MTEGWICLSVHIDTTSGKLNYAYDILSRSQSKSLTTLTQLGDGGYASSDLMNSKLYLGTSPPFSSNAKHFRGIIKYFVIDNVDSSSREVPSLIHEQGFLATQLDYLNLQNPFPTLHIVTLTLHHLSSTDVQDDEGNNVNAAAATSETDAPITNSQGFYFYPDKELILNQINAALGRSLSVSMYIRLDPFVAEGGPFSVAQNQGRTHYGSLFSLQEDGSTIVKLDIPAIISADQYELSLLPGSGGLDQVAYACQSLLLGPTTSQWKQVSFSMHQDSTSHSTYSLLVGNTICENERDNLLLTYGQSSIKTFTIGSGFMGVVRKFRLIGGTFAAAQSHTFFSNPTPDWCSSSQFEQHTQDGCRVCDASCLTCADKQYTACLTCETELKWVQTAGTFGECVACPWNTQYSYFTDDCELLQNPCHTLCQPSMCTGPLVQGCTECLHFNNTAASVPVCVQECASLSLISDYTNKLCLAGTCDSRCAGCTAPSDVSACILCADGSTPVSGSSCQCPKGTFLNATNCDPCVSSCLTCSDYSTCTECDSSLGLSLTNGQCVSTLCEDNQFFNSTTLTCQGCDATCSSCLSASQCTSCLSPLILSNCTCVTCESVTGFMTNPDGTSNCLEVCGDGLLLTSQHQCDDGNALSGDGCNSECNVEYGFTCSTSSQPSVCIDTLPPFIISAQVSSTNAITLSFSEPILLSSIEASLNDIFISVSGPSSSYPFSWELSSSSLSLRENIELLLTFTTSLFGGQQATVVINSAFIKDEAGNGLSSQDVSVGLNPFFYLSAAEQSVIAGGGNSLAGVTLLSILINVIISLVLQGSIQAMWNLLNLLQILNFLPLLNLNIPPNMSLMLQYFSFTNANFDLLQDLLEAAFPQLQELKDQNNLTEAQKGFGFDSTSFLINSLVPLLFYALSLFFLPIVLIFATLSTRTRLCKFCLPLKQSYFWNGPLRAFILNYVEFFLCLMMNFYHLQYSSLLQIASSLLTLVFLILSLALPIVAATCVMPPEPDLIQAQKAAGVLYSQLRTDKLLALYFYPLFFIRRILFVLILLTLDSQPLVQLSAVISLSLFAVLYNGIIRPYKDNCVNILATFCEICLLVILLICVALLQPLTEFYSKLSGWGVIFLVSVCVLVNISVTLAIQMKQMRQKCRQKRRKKKKITVVKPAIETQARFEEEISPPRKNTFFGPEPEEEH